MESLLTYEMTLGSLPVRTGELSLQEGVLSILKFLISLVLFLERGMINFWLVFFTQWM
jgi:hypothetical protein